MWCGVGIQYGLLMAPDEVGTSSIYVRVARGTIQLEAGGMNRIVSCLVKKN